MIDSGASGNFIDVDFIKVHSIPVAPKRIPVDLEVVDGRPIVGGQITHETLAIALGISTHSESIVFHATHLGHYQVILGIPWLRKHDPQITWSQHRLRFSSEFCLSNCLDPSISTAFTVIGVSQPFVSQPFVPQPLVSQPLATVQLSATPHSTSLDSTILMEHSSNTSQSELQHVPLEYHDFADVFSKAKADKLPEHKPYDHSILLIPESSPPFGPIYSLSDVELKTVREYLDENLAKGFIQPSSSSAGAPILFDKKKDGSLRLCVDYRGLNKITVKDRYPLPLISELLDRVRNATIFTKIDLRGAYNLIRIAKGEEWKTAFRTRYGHYEYKVMPFGLTNAPATFQRLINNVLRNFLDLFVVCYLDDILIYSTTIEDHRIHVRQVLQRLRENNLFAKPEKCIFHTSEVDFLGYIVTPSGMKMNPQKVQSVLEWPCPKSVNDLQSFLGFANYYRRFIQDYSAIVTPMTKLLKKDATFVWNNTAQAAFHILKSRFTSAPILCHFDPNKPTIIEADASDYAIGSILSQLHNGILHPVAYYSRKLIPAETNYEIYDKEMLAIISAFKAWRPYLEGSQHQIQVFTDHRNLEWFQETKQYNRRQSRWAQFLTGYDFVIHYRPGSRHGKPDALSRRSDYRPEGGDDKPTDKPILKSHQFVIDPVSLSPLVIATRGLNDNLRQAILDALPEDPAIGPHLSCLKDQNLPTPNHLRNYSLEDGLLMKNGLIYVPANDSIKLQILRAHHDSPIAGHYGQDKTLELISREFFWPGMTKFVEDYIRTCDTCARTKAPRHKPFGPLNPLPIPKRNWASVSMDFIVDLPLSRNFDAIYVVVDRLSKMAHFIPTTIKTSAQETARLFFDNVFRLHGLPEDIVSDRGTQFTSKFFTSLMDLCSIQQNLSTAFHPQSDGQTERVNQTLEQYLRAYCDYQQDNWTDLLNLAEFAYNNSSHASTHVSPFYANYGYHPTFQLKVTRQTDPPAVQSYVQRLKDIHNQLVDALKKAQARQKRYYDQHVIQSPSVTVGDKVWLLRRHIKTTRPSTKLDYRRLGPFEVVKAIGTHNSAFMLKLPPSIKIHPVFHVSLLEPYHQNTIPGRTQPPSPPIEVDGETEWTVSHILDSKIKRNRLFYLVEWEGYGPEDRTWEPAPNLRNAPDLVKEFHDHYPTKPSTSNLRSRTLRHPENAS
jgi:RNase H-like domain found in reverse transcriptase/Reverse transcriptase (RNA-dependent DNA polymerase)/Integrase zinc binding domain/Chromo (CHRromatin Organisation MOdifier) domain